MTSAAPTNTHTNYIRNEESTMSYEQRMATFEQFTKILETSAKNKFRHAPSADQIDGLMEGVVVSLLLEEMSVDYAEHVGKDKWQTYVPRHRVYATVVFDGFATYVVDVEDGEWFALPSAAKWQANLPVIQLPSEVLQKILDEAPEMTEEAKLAKARLRSGLPEEPEGGWDAVAEIRAMRDEDNRIAFGEEEPPAKADGGHKVWVTKGAKAAQQDEKTDGEGEGEEGGSGVREPLPDDSPAPTEAAARQPRKRAARKPKPTEVDTGETVPQETPVG